MSISIEIELNLILQSLDKALFKLDIPIVISLLVAALYNVVDTYFVSGLGKEAVAAVLVAFPIQLIFLEIGLIFGAGAGSYICSNNPRFDNNNHHNSFCY